MKGVFSILDNFGSTFRVKKHAGFVRKRYSYLIEWLGVVYNLKKIIEGEAGSTVIKKISGEIGSYFHRFFKPK